MVSKSNMEKRSNYDPERIRELEQELRESREIIKKLKESEAKSRSIIDYSPEGVFLIDEKGKYLEVNPAVCRITGYSKDELLTLSIQDILYAEDLEEALQHIRDVEEKGFAHGVSRFITKEGEIHYWEVSAAKVREKRILGYVMDITERKKNEEALRLSEKHNAFLAHSAIELVEFTSVQEIYKYTAHKLYELLEGNSIITLVEYNHNANRWKMKAVEGVGKKSAELSKILGFDINNLEGVITSRYYERIASGKVEEMNFDLTEYLSNKVANAINKAVKKLFGIDKVYCISFQHDNQVLGNITFSTNKESKPINATLIEAFIQQVSTIIKKLNAEAKIREKDLEFRKLSANVPDLIFQFTRRPDGSYFVPIASEGIKNIFGCRPEDVADNFDAISRVLHPDDAERVIADIEHSARHLTYFTCEFRVLIPGKPVQWILSRSTPEKLPDGSVTWYGFNANITEHKKVEETLEESATGLREAQRLANIGNWTWNLKTGELNLSDEMYSIIGMEKTAKVLDVSSHKKYYTPESWERFSKATENAMRTGKSYEIELDVLPANGKMRHTVARGEARYGPDGKVEQLSGTLQDITYRKQAEIIKQSQYNIAVATITTRSFNDLIDIIRKELDKIFDAKNFFIALYNEETGMLHSPLFVDEKDDIHEWPAEKSLTGYLIKQNRPLLLQKSDILRLHEEGVIEIMGPLAEAWMGVPLKMGKNILGAVVFQNYHNANVYDQSSLEVLELIAHELSLFIDRQNAEDKANKLTRAVEQSSVAVIITNRQGAIEYVNPFFTQLTGYRIEEVKGQIPSILQAGNQSKEFHKKLWDVILSGNNWEGEFIDKKKTGELYWGQAVISPIVNADGLITHFVSINEDITERKKMVEDLIQAKDKAQQSDRLKSAFLANMSHEIRTPMNGILGFLELLSDPDLGEDVKAGYLDIVKKSGQRLLSTINDIIEISKIESGDMMVSMQEIKLTHFLSYYYDFFLPQAKGKGLQLEFIPCKSCPDTIVSDNSKLDSILTNLIKNAIKFTEKGKVAFGCEQKDKKTLLFYVKDTGKGIPPDKIDLVFERFIQADNLNTRVYEGAGLGLSITKAYVEYLGGKIWVVSEPGKGSCFFFTLPIVEHDHASSVITKNEEDRSAPLPKKLKLLICEDDNVSFMFLEAVLKKYDFEIKRCVNGQEAVQYCQSNPDVDLILMDIGMPVMDGYEATRCIRKFNKDVVIIAQTAFAISRDSEKVKEAGCNDYLPKPINKERLFEIIKKYFNT